MRQPQPGKAPWSTVMPGQASIASQRVMPLVASVVQPVPLWAPCVVVAGVPPSAELPEPELEPELDPPPLPVPASPPRICWRSRQPDVASAAPTKTRPRTRRIAPMLGRCPLARPGAKFSATVAGMPNDANLATSALDRLVVVLGEDAIYVLAGGAREAKEALESLVTRRGHAYAAAVQGQPLARMGTEFEAWMVEMARALAPVAPPPWIPMMDVVREKVTLELGARGLRSLFSKIG